VMVVLRNNPDQIHHLLIEIYHGKGRFGRGANYSLKCYAGQIS